MPDQLNTGDSAPRFYAKALSGNPNFAFDTVAGRYIVMLFFGKATNDDAIAALNLVKERAALFNDEHASFFGVTIDPEDESEKRIAQELPGRRYFLDYDGKISYGYGAIDEEMNYLPHWLLLDINMRAIATAPIMEGAKILDLLAELTPPAKIDRFAPVIVVPDIFEPELCRKLVDLYEANGGEDSGFMRDVDGKTVGIIDHSHKKREDWVIDDMDLRTELRTRIEKRLIPQIRKSFQFNVSRMERYMVACYDGESGGFFRPHRDNTTAGTAHRRFACTINLNAEDYEGGDLRFPEFGHRTYRAPTGGAVVFSCSLLHEARPVTSGRRYCFLPFLYDDEAAKIREANNAKLSEELGEYRA